MSIRNHTPALLTLALLTACQPAPANADVLNNLPARSVRPRWYPPTTWRHLFMGGNHYDFDPDTGPLALPSIQDPYWPSPYGTWGAGTAPLPLPAPDVMRRCRPVHPAVPGPLPVMGVAAAFAYSRKLRQRIFFK